MAIGMTAGLLGLAAGGQATAADGSGDLNGDGRADLLARDTSGVLWSYRGDGKGALAARTKVGGGWQTYKNLF
ncbi:hypothetical protein GT034_14725 [Streptomyces sp. SID2563]|uniref:FG-GAP repeat domain-containing protein n=1 Tax=Streptomyces sp. SID2563 TaxID=2690255 RepID=UPI0013F79B08|nr:VCBS repeat-containing protein [Streptomyces sp. SID2563]MYW09602.1 hypothetical protein [Streptomyces sp. SID2563]